MTLFDSGRRSDDAAEADQPEGAVGGHPRLLRPQPALAVHGSDQSAGRADAQAPSVGPRAGRSLAATAPGFEVRDVHPSHYGRICPIETPEGPNIGLIPRWHLCPHQRFRFPRNAVSQGRERPGDRRGRLPDRRPRGELRHRPGQRARSTRRAISPTRPFRRGIAATFIDVEPARVDYMDVSPKQLVSVAAGLIPFLEHDDANRALMGSNMQRQARAAAGHRSAARGTGLEERVARDSRAVIVAEEAGKVASRHRQTRSSSPQDGKLPEGKKKLKTRPRARASTFTRCASSCARTPPPASTRRSVVQQGRAGQEGPGHRRRSLHRRAANWPWAATCSSRSCRGTATTSRTPS